MTDNSQTRIARRKQKKTTKKPIWKKIVLTTALIILAIGIGVGALFTYYIATAPDLDEELLTNPFSSKVYNMDDEIFADLGDKKRTKIEFDDLPEVLIDAVTATEDVRFFNHFGIDLKRIGGAIKANITNGFGSEGASTITQQVVENAFLTPDKKIKLKVQEQWLALKLEREYSKEQILEMYLNTIFYGSGSYGVAKASEIYFGKTNLHDLTLVEAAILAGLPQRPSAYNPYENPDLMRGRVDTVLTLMVRHDKISEQEAEEARQVDIPSLLAGKRPDSTPYEAFIQKVRDEVSEKVDGADIYTDGLKIYTTLDNDIQDHVEFLLTDSEENPINYGNDNVQAATVVLDTNSGAIRAIGGSRNSEGIDGYNYATRGGQQPGSTFKPIIAYGPAIEYNKWSTYHQINDDKPFELGTNHAFHNYDNRFHGWVSMRTGLSKSYNIPALKTLEETGAENAKKFAEGLGIQFADDQVNIGEAIGGTDTNTTPLQLAGAYRAFGNEGIYNEPYAVTKVEFPDGKVVELKPESEAVMSDYTAYMITDMLKTVMKEGTGTNGNIPGLPVAGKTGTNNLENEDGSPDSWLNGYTTNYTISVWTGGYDDKGNRAVLPDTQTSLYLFKNIMTEISKDVDTADFVKPDSVVEVAVEKGSNPAMLPSKYTPKSNIVTELFVKGHEPSKKSEKYDQLDPVNNLTATYVEDSNTINIKWKYDSDADVSFEVSASENDGQMQILSSTEDKSLDISEVDAGAEYEIQVVVVSNEDEANKSDAKTTKLKIPEEKDEEEDEEKEEEDQDEEKPNEEGNISSVENLSSSYDSDRGLIDVSWQYNGPPATFEVDVNGQQQQTVQSNGIEIGGVSPGQTYTIKVTPIGQNGANEGVRGDPRSVTQEVTAPDADESGDPEENP